MMQIPPHRCLLVHHIRRPPAEAAKYARTEFGDEDPSWLFAGAPNDGHAKDDYGCGAPDIVRKAQAGLQAQALLRDRCGADH